MSFQGTGTGFLNYQIQNEQSVNAAQCAVTALEDDDAGTLTLNVSFVDAIHGQVQVGISLFNYSPSTTTYNNIEYLMIAFNCEYPVVGGWASNTGSSVSLSVTQANGSSATSYSGTFNASNLTWEGAGHQDSMAIKFASFAFQVTESLTAAAIEYQTGAGSGSVTYQIGDAPSQSQAASASTVSYDNGGTLYGVILNVQWTDAVEGNVVVMLIVDPFTGTGIYSSTDPNQVLTILFSTVSAGNGNWANGNNPSPQVTLDTIYSEADNVAQWQGTLSGRELIWQGDGSQPDLNVKISELTLTVQQKSDGL